MVERLDENRVVEQDNVIWGALVVLAAKTHQENLPWHEYQWRICASYQNLNHVTRPFTFPIPRCDGSVKDIDTEANYFIAVYMDSGYWKVVAKEEARKIQKFFTLDGKHKWKVMPMGDLNVAPTFALIMMKIQMDLDTIPK